MKIIVIDDEIAALNTFLLGIVDRSEIECNMFLHDPLLSIQYVKDNKVDVAFLDINMPIINGVDLAEKLIEADGRIKIIFISGYTQDIKKINQRLGENLIGFCNKPYDIDELNNLLMKAIAESNKDKTILIKTFGTFDVFIDKNAVKFSCAKSKELLAILVNARGGYVNMDCAIAALWPDKYVLNSKRLYRDAVYKLRKDLGEYGLNIVEYGRAQLRVLSDNLKCDYWEYMKEKTPYYQGIYMAGYDWSLDTQTTLDELYKNL